MHGYQCAVMSRRDLSRREELKSLSILTRYSGERPPGMGKRRFVLSRRGGGAQQSYVHDANQRQKGAYN